MGAKLIISICILFCSLAHAEIYSWVDENGKKHFGDKVPARYQQDAVGVEVNIHKPSEEEIGEAKKIEAELERSNQESIAQQRRSAKVKHKNNNLEREKTYDSEYDKKMEDYNESRSCFSFCQKQLQSGGYNNAACGHCKDVKKP